MEPASGPVGPKHHLYHHPYPWERHRIPWNWQETPRIQRKVSIKEYYTEQVLLHWTFRRWFVCLRMQLHFLPLTLLDNKPKRRLILCTYTMFLQTIHFVKHCKLLQVTKIQVIIRKLLINNRNICTQAYICRAIKTFQYKIRNTNAFIDVEITCTSDLYLLPN